MWAVLRTNKQLKYALHWVYGTHNVHLLKHHWATGDDAPTGRHQEETARGRLWKADARWRLLLFFVLNSLRCMEEATVTPPTQTEKKTNTEATIYHWLFALEYTDMNSTAIKKRYEKVYAIKRQWNMKADDGRWVKYSWMWWRQRWVPCLFITLNIEEEKTTTISPKFN